MRVVFFLITGLFLWAGPAMGEPLRVVTDIPAVHSLVSGVMGNLGEPALLIQTSDDPHHMQLRPSQARNLARADIVFWVGPNLTPWLGHALDSLAGKSEVTSLLSIPETHLRPNRNNPTAIDPHAWLDPENAIIWLPVIAENLAKLDPDNRQVYLANAERVKEQINQLLPRVNAILATSKTRDFVFYHDAYGYFSNRFSLQIAGVLVDNDAVEPGAARLSEIQALLKSGSIACFFIEPGKDIARLQPIVGNSGVTLVPLDLTGAKIDIGPTFYETLIEQISTEIASCSN